MMHGGTAEAMVSSLLWVCVFISYMLIMCVSYVVDVCDAWEVPCGACGWCATPEMHVWRVV
jgi:hypothetical protein